MFLNMLRSVRRSATLIFLDLYLRQLQDDLLLQKVAQSVPPAGMQEDQTLEWTTAFPKMRHWIGERLAQDAFKDKIQLKLEPYEVTYKLDSFKLKLDQGSSLITEPERMGPYFAEAYATGRLMRAYRPLRDNLLTYDKQSFFDDTHYHPDGSEFSNLIAVPRADDTAPTMLECRNELKEMQGILQRNRLNRDAIYEVKGDMSDLTVVVKSDGSEAGYRDLLQEERLPDTTINRFRGKFTLVRDPAPKTGTENDVDYILSEPGGPRPAVIITAQEPGQIVPLQPADDRRTRDLLFGNDAIYAFGAAFPQTAARRTQAVP